MQASNKDRLESMPWALRHIHALDTIINICNVDATQALTNLYRQHINRRILGKLTTHCQTAPTSSQPIQPLDIDIF